MNTSITNTILVAFAMPFLLTPNANVMTTVQAKTVASDIQNSKENIFKSQQNTIDSINDLSFFTKILPKFTTYKSNYEFFAKAIEDINSYSKLDQGWDGADGIPPSQKNIELSTSFLAKLPSKVMPPKTMLSSNGEIGFYWSNSEAYADIAISDDESISMFTKIKSNTNDQFKIENFVEVASIDVFFELEFNDKFPSTFSIQRA